MVKSSRPMPSDTADVVESATTSETKSFSPKEDLEVADKSLSLDELFAELKKESTKNGDDDQKRGRGDFHSIQQSIKNMPKLNSKLEDVLDQTSQKPRGIVKINDTVTNVKSKIKDEPTDSGSKWFHMKQGEVTPEIKRDMMVIKHRNALDPKRHYKKEKWDIPKYFHMGTIIEGNTDYYSGRLRKSERGNTLVEEVLNDTDKRDFFKRKYNEIQAKKTSGGKKHYKKIKSMRKKY